jgi:large subunit ribosomal protein L4
MSPAKSSSAAKPKAGSGPAAVLPPEIFDAKVNVPLIHQVVVAQEAAARQGTHSTKTRGEVRGGGKKPYRQKGTGRARQGSTRAPQYAGGGVVHGPRPRSYEQKTPKKMTAAALRGALSDRARHGRVHVVESLVEAGTPKTQLALAALAAVTDAPDTAQVLVVISEGDELTRRCLRNAPSVQLLPAGQLNTRDVLVNDFVVFTREALDRFVARMRGEPVQSPVKGGNEAGSASAAKVSEPSSEAADEPSESAADQPAEPEPAPAKPRASRAKAKQEDDQQ